jgi:hypothetical protein
MAPRPRSILSYVVKVLLGAMQDADDEIFVHPPCTPVLIPAAYRPAIPGSHSA